jgi:hypothetical protein
MFLKLFLIQLILINFFVFSQETNIVFPNLIDTVNLKVTNFKNGDPLLKINVNENSDYKKTWHNNINKPEVLISKSGEYIYNYAALVDKRNLCRNNKKVIKIDLNNNSFNTITIPKSDYLSHSPSCDTGEIAFSTLYTLANGYFLATGDYFHYFIESNHDNKLDSTKNIKFIDFKNNRIESVPQYSGGPTRCNYLSYEDYFNYATLTSKEILKPYYSEFINKISTLFSYSINSELKSKIEINWEFDKNYLSSNIISNELKLEEKNRIKLVLKNSIPSPIYKGNYLNTNDTVSISLKLNNKRFTKGELNSAFYELNSSEKFKKHVYNTKLGDNINKCILLQSKAKYIHPKYTIQINNKSIEVEPTMYSVKCPGPLNSFYSIIPGLGLNQFKSSSYKIEKKSKLLLTSSISVAVIGIVSKIISDTYYNSFIRNKNSSNSQSNYDIANNANKVFIVSSAVYSSLILIDFSCTFSIGIKNKKTQRLTNKGLKNLHKQNLWL